MEAELFTKLTKAIRFLSTSPLAFAPYKYEFTNYYRIYNISILEGREELQNVLEQLAHTEFASFFTETHLEENHYGEEFLKGVSVIIGEKELKIHSDMYQILFYFLANELKDSLEQFLDVIKSEAFKNKFKGIIEVSETEFKYPLDFHKDIRNHITNEIGDFDQILELLSHSYSLFKVEGRNCVFGLNSISGVLDNLDNVYSLDEVEIN